MNILPNPTSYTQQHVDCKNYKDSIFSNVVKT